MYWSAEGALVVDYEVTPDTEGNVESWWEQNYGTHPDMAFILPWRYDSEKGNAGPNFELQAQETRDILLSPRDPQPGEKVNIIARVHNFSLQGVNSFSNLRFYLDDPSNEANLIVNENGQSEVEIPPIGSRGATVVQLENWLVPENIDGHSRIYGVLDNSNQIEEVHENNNVGWIPINNNLVTSTENESTTLTLKPKRILKHPYPNPTTGDIDIAFFLRKNSQVRISILDLNGREISLVTDAYYQSGEQALTFSFKNDFQPGVYIVKLQTEDVVNVSRVVLSR